MKRWLLALVLVVASAIGGHALYRNLCPRVASSHCTMQWLRVQLQLDDAQYARIESLHRHHEPIIRETHKVCDCSKIVDAEAGLCACMRATQDLIDAVCAELSPAQRERYRALVAPCSHHKGYPLSSRP